jgi:hypothetical protein
MSPDNDRSEESGPMHSGFVRGMAQCAPLVSRLRGCLLRILQEWRAIHRCTYSYGSPKAKLVPFS